MSLAKTIPKGIEDKECKRFALQEHPPVPYVPEKNPVQEMVPALKSDQSLKTTTGKEAKLCIPIWHNGMWDAFLMHLSKALDAIEKRGTFKAYKEASKAYLEQCKVVKHTKAALALLMAPTSKGKKASEKISKKASKKLSNKASEKALQKTKEGAALANAPAPELHAEYQANNKAKSTTETTKKFHKAAATKMFQSYANLLSLDAKYAWNKIVKEQTEADLFKDLQGMSRKGPR
jgi:hypothetical protein